MDHEQHGAHGTGHAEPEGSSHSGHEMAASHDRHEGHSVAMFRDKFWLTLALTIPVVILSRDIQEWFGHTCRGASTCRWPWAPSR